MEQTSKLNSSKHHFFGGSGDGWGKFKNIANLNTIYLGGNGDGWSSVVRPLGTLPVTLLYFTAIKQNKNNALLQWKTSQEINSAFFDVERSADAIIFNKIGTVAAAGNTTTPTAYSIIDYSPNKGSNYYRLKQVDVNGRISYSPTKVLLFDVDNIDFVKYYPNPTKDIVNISFTNAAANEALVINIINEMGVLVHQYKTTYNSNNTIQLNLSAFAKGVYFMQLKSATINSTKKIVLQ
ncbi:T9SS type A sorting domain-containing protein [Ferruginibacter yonginensis]|uniref:T9SS type A sorting domain-containing protein n=1 Tax=Ferruginibacter yonginensis TaxID=1310416 RepID=A0ABV8QPL1_9BACT